MLRDDLLQEFRALESQHLSVFSNSQNTPILKFSSSQILKFSISLNLKRQRYSGFGKSRLRDHRLPLY